MPRSPKFLAPLASPSSPTIALVTDSNDWHTRALCRAFAAVGARARRLMLAACRFDTTSPKGLILPGLGAGLPNAVLVRDMAGGSFEAVTLRLGVLHALQEIGIPVWNNARAIERCVDKSMTSFLLARAGLPTPATWAAESFEAAAEIVRQETSPLVLKPLFGSQGRGLKLIYSPEELPPPSDVAGVYYLTRYVGVERDGFHDFRCVVYDRRVLAALLVRSSHWVTKDRKS